jgi:hypothetical protein
MPNRALVRTSFGGKMEHFLFRVGEVVGFTALVIVGIIHAIGYIKYVWSKR